MKTQNIYQDSKGLRFIESFQGFKYRIMFEGFEFSQYWKTSNRFEIKIRTLIGNHGLHIRRRCGTKSADRSVSFQDKLELVFGLLQLLYLFLQTLFLLFQTLSLLSNKFMKEKKIRNCTWCSSLLLFFIRLSFLFKRKKEEKFFFANPIHQIYCATYIFLLIKIQIEIENRFYRLFTSNRALVWSILRLRHLAAAILFLSLRICRLSSSSGVIPIVLVGLLPPILRLAGCCGCCDCCGCCGCVCWLSTRVVLVATGAATVVVTTWCAAVFCVCAGVGCEGSTNGGTNPASRLCDADSLVSSRKVCSILRSVVGVNVGVVLVGTPLCRPSRETSCNEYEICN